MSDFENVNNTFRLLDAALTAPKPLDQATLDAAEKVVRDRIPKTTYRSEAQLLKRVANDIHKLGGAS